MKQSTPLRIRPYRDSNNSPQPPQVFWPLFPKYLKHTQVHPPLKPLICIQIFVGCYPFFGFIIVFIIIFFIIVLLLFLLLYKRQRGHGCCLFIFKWLFFKLSLWRDVSYMNALSASSYFIKGIHLMTPLSCHLKCLM